MTTEAEARVFIAEENAKKATEEAQIREFVFEALAEEKKVNGLTAEQIAIVEKAVSQERVDQALETEDLKNLVISVAEEKENAPYNDMFGKILVEIHEKEKRDTEKQALADIKGCLAKYKE